MRAGIGGGGSGALLASKDADGVYQTAQRLARHTGGGLVETPLLPGLQLDVDEVFAAA